MEPANDIRVEEVDRAVLRSSWRLRFSPALERLFEEECVAERCRRIVRQNWLGLAIYLVFLCGDLILIPDRFWASVVLHLGVMTPVMVLINRTIARQPPVWLRETLLAGGIILATVAILGLMLASRSPLRTSEHISVVLVILFATMMQRIRFPYVVVACVVSAGLYLAALAQLTDGAEWQRKAVAAAVFCGVVLFSIIGCWNLEREQRANFLLRLRDRLRHRELEVLSRRDALTGAGNRLALDEAMERCRSAEPASAPTAVLLFDVDHFKAYNDVHGHLAGDACLHHVAGVIAANVRGGSMYRFGGEEFLVLVERADLAAALASAERVRAAVAAAAIPRGEAAVVTVSAGVAAAALDGARTIDDLVAEADAALYAAKRGGRNQVRAAAAAQPQQAA